MQIAPAFDVHTSLYYCSVSGPQSVNDPYVNTQHSWYKSKNMQMDHCRWSIL